MADIDFEKFETARLCLLEQLEAGKIDKREFLKKSHEMFLGLNCREPDKITLVLHGVFYYYYFNTMAKAHMMQSKSFCGCHQATISNEYYEIKESVLRKLITLFKDKELQAYYVNTGSAKLKHKLVELVAPDYEKLVFHTLDCKTIACLKRRGILDTEQRDSLISDYINTKYY